MKTPTLAPLRKIVDTFTNAHGAQMERLECGHAVHRKEDIYGPTNANRRRCKQCRAGTVQALSTEAISPSVADTAPK